MNESDPERMRRVFEESFAVRDVAEALLSFDEHTSVGDVRAAVTGKNVDVVGIRHCGRVAGYAECSELTGGVCGDYLLKFDASKVMGDSSSLDEIVTRLNVAPRIFIRSLGTISGVVRRIDLEKPAVRMWLFGMVTLIEMRFTKAIELFCPGDTWQEFITESRLARARALQAERLRRHQDVDLLSCMQFSDKGQIIAKNEAIRRTTRFESRRAVEKAIKDLERLRNNLAHAQDIIESDWGTIVQLTENLENVIQGPPGLRSG